ncbi:RNA-binding protein [Desulfitispora alkaliphila]|uniref:ribosome assembly RNA-binding protein YhbY n=1 Tax=Desulfitispora alkaliphila TaxID=622674 RepID=UPI003D23C040
MLTGKQKRFLRALGTKIDPIFQVGKTGINDNMVNLIDDALEARELVKVRVLQNCLLETKDVARELAIRTNSALVQVVGRNLLLYRRSIKKEKIELP